MRTRLASLPILAALFLLACSNAPHNDAGVDVPRVDGADAVPADDGVTSDTPVADPCNPNPCTAPNRTTCAAPLGIAECRCNAGYEEQSGQCVPVTMCTATTCSGHGDCHASGGMLTCTCTAGYAGTFCDACDNASGYFDDGHGVCTRDPCTPNPCTQPERSLCTVSTAHMAVCQCNAGTHDDAGVCVPDAMCTATTCAGHGTCTMTSTATQCACDTGWGGAHCDACDATAGYHADGAGGCTRDLCLPNPCAQAHRTVCSSDGVSTSCACDAGYHLEIDACVLDEVCMPGTCSAHGTCSVVGGRTTCACDAGWTGTACDACASGYHVDGAGGCTMDPCLPNPCNAPNQTTCVAMGTTPTCVCDTGAHPDGIGGCTTDPCTPDPCVATNQACRVVGTTAQCYTPPCDDGNPCTDDAVVSGVCRHTNRADGSSCSTDICRASEICTAGVCGGGSARTCDDGNPCTRDTCVSPTGCTFTNDDTLAPAEDGIVCTVERCSAGMSQHVPTNAQCDDGLWCNGTEVCMPGSAADARGCVTTSVPQPTSPNTPCRTYVCDESSRSFTPQDRPAGSSCNDGIACTTGDTCSASGLCTGSVTASCDPSPTAACTPGGSLVTTIDIGVAPVTGVITQNGSPLSLTTNTYENGVVWARARDTGVLHRLALIDWTRGGSYPNYTRSAGSDRIQTTLVPGVYDVLYQRAYQTSGDYVSERSQSPSPDPVVNGYRVIVSGVVIPAGGRTLDVDIGATVVTGTVTQNGAALSLTTNTYENGVVWARARDTGKLHRLVLIDWTRGGSYPTYTRSAGSDQIRTLLVPGAYDILYQRAYQTSGDYVSERSQSPSADPVVNGYRVLTENVMISGASQTVNVDIGTTVVTGTVTMNGAALPLTTNTYENGVVWARARDTGKLHRLVLIDWTRGGTYPTYTRSAGSDQIRTMLVPGAYDILYQRAYQTSGDYVSERSLSPAPDAVVNGYRVLTENVTISGASQTLNVDIGATVVTGTVTMNGGALPLTTNTYENGVIWARAIDTGKLHRLVLIDWTRGGSYPTYTRSAGSDQINTTLVPGAYDILYQRALQSSANYVSERSLSPAPDTVVNGYRVLQQNVTIAGASQVVNVDIGATVVTGTVTQNGAPLSLTTNTYENGVVWARAQDTGRLHRLLLIDWTRGGTYPNYTRSAGSDHINTSLVPGVYDILYQRAYQTSGQYVTQQSLTPSADPVVNGYRVLQQNVTINGASRVLDVDIASVVVAGTITMNAAPLSLTTNTYENGVIWLRSRDTGILHRLALIDWTRGGTYPNYTRSAGSDQFDSTFIPGVYDVLYQRAYQTSGQYVTQQSLTPSPDPVVNGYRVLQGCVLVN